MKYNLTNGTAHGGIAEEIH